jgi:carbamoyl-phosphate synthase large subunit
MDASPHFLHVAEADHCLLSPRRSDAAAWLDALNRAIRRFGVDAVLPNNSLDAQLLGQHRDAVDAALFLPSQAAFRLGEDKWEAWKCFRGAGLPVPDTWLLRSRQDVEEAFSMAGSSPVWVRGAGIPGKGVGVASLPARTVEQAVEWVEFWNGWGAMAASRFLPGRNLTWLGVFDQGRLVASQGRERDAYVIPHVSPSGITGAPAISHTVCRSDINELGLKACLAVDPQLSGPAFVDFKEDGRGVPNITEINVGRLGTTHHFYSVAGANFPLLLLALALGRPLPEWVRPLDVLAPDLYWVRNLDCGPRLVTADQIAALVASGEIPSSTL